MCNKFYKVTQIYIEAQNQETTFIKYNEALLLNTDELQALRKKLQEGFKIIYRVYPAVKFYNENDEEYPI
jgi:hypothetical protein